MAGGIWLSQNKSRPGAYINFKSVPKNAMTVGDRGIVAIALPLSWGAENELIEVLSSDLLDGTSRKKIGFTAFDAESKLLAGALSYCYKALVYRTNTGGAKATATIEGLTVTAKYPGTFGNKINVAVVDSGDGSVFNVITYVNGEVVDNQQASQISDLVANDYVEWSGEGELTANAGTPLTSGTNGSSEEETYYPKLLGLLKMKRWQVFSCNSSSTSIQKNVCDFIKQMRDDEGRYVQAVVGNYDASDSEGIINSVSGAVIDGIEFSVQEFVAIIAGITAGASAVQSNTAREIKGATKIIGELTDAEIKEGLSKGHLMLSTSASGKIKIEQDINSLHSFTKDKDYNFSKNRVIRTLDEIGTTTSITWEDNYMGKVDNNVTGRTIFKSDLIAYGTELQRISAIQEFEGADDIEVVQGDGLDSVLVTWGVKPVDSMEKLYMTINVRG